MNLAEAIGIVETMLQRSLWGDEIAMLAQMVKAGRDSAEIVAAFNEERPPDIPDGEVDTYRYEPAGAEQARRIQ